MSHGITEKGATERTDDVNLLMLPFRERVIALDGRMKTLDFDPIIWETYRSPERAQELVRLGKSKAKGGLSMHCFGIAADFVCAHHHWDCHKHKCKFFIVLGQQAKACGLAWGGDWDNNPATDDGWDQPHVQAVPIGRPQRLIRAAKTHDERKTIVVKYMGAMRP